MESSAGLYFMVGIFLLSGGLSVVASLRNWDWFFNSQNARMLTGRFSRRTARWIYFVAGVLILSMAAWIVLKSHH